MKTRVLIVILFLIIIAGVICAVVYSPLSTEQSSNNPAQNSKLNMNVVCESALTYMTFTYGADADKFIAECKEGKHPEVIEHYKAQMNLGEGAAI